VVGADGKLTYVKRSEAYGKQAPQPMVATQGEEGVTYTPRSQSAGQARPKTSPSSTPHTRVRRDRMIMQWDPETEDWFETGMYAPSPKGSSGSSSQERLQTQAALNAVQKSMPKPSTIDQSISVTGPNGRRKRAPNPKYAEAVRDSTEIDRAQYRPLLKRLIEMGGGVDETGDQPDFSDVRGGSSSAKAPNAGAIMKAFAALTDEQVDEAQVKGAKTPQEVVAYWTKKGKDR
jgi:hypothetical protein